jgi:hypothetical protein
VICNLSLIVVGVAIVIVIVVVVVCVKKGMCAKNSVGPNGGEVLNNQPPLGVISTGHYPNPLLSIFTVPNQRQHSSLSYIYSHLPKYKDSTFPPINPVTVPSHFEDKPRSFEPILNQNSTISGFELPVLPASVYQNLQK